VGCTTTLQFTKATTFTLYLESKGKVGDLGGDCASNGKAYDLGTATAPKVTLSLVDSKDAEVTLAAGGTRHYNEGGYTGQAIQQATITAPGTYRLTVATPTPTRPRAPTQASASQWSVCCWAVRCYCWADARRSPLHPPPVPRRLPGNRLRLPTHRPLCSQPLCSPRTSRPRSSRRLLCRHMNHRQRPVGAHRFTDGSTASCPRGYCHQPWARATNLWARSPADSADRARNHARTARTRAHGRGILPES
jgi:hypothetical protein